MDILYHSDSKIIATDLKQCMLTCVSLVVFPLAIAYWLTTGTPEILTLLVSVFVVVEGPGDDMLSVLVATQSSPFSVPTYGECFIPKDLDGIECNVSIACQCRK